MLSFGLQLVKQAASSLLACSCVQKRALPLGIALQAGLGLVIRPGTCQARVGDAWSS